MDQRTDQIDVDSFIQFINSIALHFFSWTTMTIVSIFISGKLITRNQKIDPKSSGVIPINIKYTNTSFNINTNSIVFGFTSYLLSFSFSFFILGNAVYEVFRDRSGLEVNQWHSHCITASSISLVSAFVIFCLRIGFHSFSLQNRSEIASTEEHQKVIRRTKEIHNQNKTQIKSVPMKCPVKRSKIN